MPEITVPDDRLRQFRDDPDVCVTDDVRSMAAELLALRAYATDHEGRCDTLCPRCGVDIGLKRCDACGRPRFSDRHLAQVTRERDEARALAEDLGQRCDELAAKRNPDDDVLVEGSWFHPDDLPKILGNHMRSVAEEQRRTKDAVIALNDARARVTALQAALDGEREAKGVREHMHTVEFDADGHHRFTCCPTTEVGE